MGNGKIPEESIRNLLDAGKWLKVNGEAVYGSKPWTSTSEGPHTIQRSRPGGEKGSFDRQLTPQHFWFTRKGNNIYVSALKRPEDSKIVIKALKGIPIKRITMLGESEAISWKETDNGVLVTLPGFKNSTPGYALKIIQ